VKEFIESTEAAALVRGLAQTCKMRHLIAQACSWIHSANALVLFPQIKEFIESTETAAHTHVQSRNPKKWWPVVELPLAQRIFFYFAGEGVHREHQGGGARVRAGAHHVWPPPPARRYLLLRQQVGWIAPVSTFYPRKLQ